MNLATPQPGTALTLREVIAQRIRAQGPIPFSEYMELCLYHPELGYYSRAQEKFGKAGDFYTSSDVHAVFGRLLARQFDEMWRVLGSPSRIDVIELGPGRGLFAADVFDWSEKKFPDFFAALRYTLVESSGSLRERLHVRLENRIQQGKASVVERLEEADSGEAPAIVFANEFFDALPVSVIAPEGEVYVGLAPAATSGPARFVEAFAPASGEALEFLDRYGIHPEAGERVEAAPAYGDWMRRISQRLGASKNGFAVIIDYGYTRDELLAGRHRGTIACFRRHTMSDTPYDAPGEQDITAHVNFTALAELGRRSGLEPQKLVTQSSFLLGIGEATRFDDAFEECRLPQERAKVALQLKHLITPEGMGESFQVLVLSKGVPKEKTAQLSGLSFASSPIR
jgi:SAM-dependent MidA family methyltransferase